MASLIVRPCDHRFIVFQKDWDEVHSTPEGKACPDFEYCNRWINPANADGNWANLEAERVRNGGKLFPHDIPEGAE